MSAISTTYSGFPVLIHTDTGLSQLNLPVSSLAIDSGNAFETIGKVWQKRDNVKIKYYNRKITQKYIVTSQADIQDFVDFFVARQGRYEPFFAPVWINYFTPAETVSSSATLKVHQANRDDFYSANNIIRKDVIVFENNLGSTGQYRKISSVTDGLASNSGFDTITFDSAIDANPDSLITELIWCHFGSDDLRVSALGADRYSISITLIEDQGDLAL